MYAYIVYVNLNFRKHFKDYSELLFKTYGDRVKHWTTINEAEVQALSLSVHNLGQWSTENCKTTKICTEVYTVLHNLLISHATTSKLYKSKFQVRHILKILCYIASTLSQNIDRGSQQHE